MQYYDHATGLPTYSLFLDRLTQAVALGRRQDSLLALVRVDFEHAEALRGPFVSELAERLLRELRDTDSATVANAGYMLILLNTVSGRMAAEAVVTELQAALAHPLATEVQRLRPQPSARLALFPRDGETAQALLGALDVSLYEDVDSA